MTFRRLLVVVAFAAVYSPAMSALADVSPPCEECFFASAGDACTTMGGAQPGKCVNDAATGCLVCKATTGTGGATNGSAGGAGTGKGGAGTGAGGSGSKEETSGGCSMTAARQAAPWGLLALSLLLVRRRRR